MHSNSETGRTNHHPAGDRETIVAVLDGDHRAFEQLVIKYQRPLYAVIRRLVRCHEDTDDLLQECFVRVFQHLRQFDLERPLYPWLHQIAVNLAVTFLRRRSRQQPLTSADIFPTAEADPQENAESSEFYHALEQAIDKLPVEQRTILLLRAGEGMSYNELSKTLGIEIGTVMSRLARAREKLRAWMRPYLTSPSQSPKG